MSKSNAAQKAINLSAVLALDTLSVYSLSLCLCISVHNTCTDWMKHGCCTPFTTCWEFKCTSGIPWLYFREDLLFLAKLIQNCSYCCGEFSFYQHWLDDFHLFTGLIRVTGVPLTISLLLCFKSLIHCCNAKAESYNNSRRVTPVDNGPGDWPSGKGTRIQNISLAQDPDLITYDKIHEGDDEKPGHYNYGWDF